MIAEVCDSVTGTLQLQLDAETTPLAEVCPRPSFSLLLDRKSLLRICCSAPNTSILPICRYMARVF